MAKSGYTTVAVTAHDTLRFDWSSTPNVANNTSAVSWTFKLITDAYGRINTSNSRAWSVTVNGNNYSGTKNYSIGNSSTLTIASGTTTVAHNSDGTKTFAFSFSATFTGITFSGKALGVVSGSGSGTLDTIPRASGVSAGNMTMGTAANITITPAASGFTHTLSYKFGSASGTIVSKTSSNSVSWTPPLSLASQIPSATSGTLTITCDTYSGSTKIGTSTCAVTLSVPAGVVPTISAVAVSEGTSGLASQFGCYVQNRSTLAVQITAAGVYGSTIRSCSTTFQGKTYTGSSFTTASPTASGTLRLVTTVTDTRGRTATAATDVTIVAYAVPAISAFTATRCDRYGEEDTEGDYVRLTCHYAVSPVNDRNTASAKVEYKRSSAGAWESSPLYQSSDFTGSGTVVPATALSSDFGWDLRLTVSDYFQSTSYTQQVLSALYGVDFILSADGEVMGAAFGKAAEETGLLDSAWPIRAPNLYSSAAANAVESGNAAVTVVRSQEDRYGRAYSCYLRFDLSETVYGGNKLFTLSAVPAVGYVAVPFYSKDNNFGIAGTLWTGENSGDVLCYDSIPAGTYYAIFAFTAAESGGAS